MWGKRNGQSPSTLRYCQTAYELPLRELVDSPNITIAVAQACRNVGIPRDDEEERYALGVLHTAHGMWADGSLDPLLPTRINFGAKYRDEQPFASASLDFYNDDSFPHYRLELRVDDEGELFSKLATALAHARISTRNFVHLTFVKVDSAELMRRPAKNSNELQEKIDRRKALAERLEAGTEELSSIAFKSVWFDDRINSASPSWATAWHDADTLEPTAFHDRMVAKARARRKLPAPRSRS